MAEPEVSSAATRRFFTPRYLDFMAKLGFAIAIVAMVHAVYPTSSSSYAYAKSVPEVSSSSSSSSEEAFFSNRSLLDGLTINATSLTTGFSDPHYFWTRVVPVIILAVAFCGAIRACIEICTKGSIMGLEVGKSFTEARLGLPISAPQSQQQPHPQPQPQPQQQPQPQPQPHPHPHPQPQPQQQPHPQPQPQQQPHPQPPHPPQPQQQPHPQPPQPQPGQDATDQPQGPDPPHPIPV